MKKGIHPKYVKCEVTCACGNSFATRATVPALKVDICNMCHPFYTGKQKFVDTAGRVQRFRERYGDYRKRRGKGKGEAEGESKGEAEAEAQAPATTDEPASTS